MDGWMAMNVYRQMMDKWMWVGCGGRQMDRRKVDGWMAVNVQADG